MKDYLVSKVRMKKMFLATLVILIPLLLHVHTRFFSFREYTAAADVETNLDTMHSRKTDFSHLEHMLNITKCQNSTSDKNAPYPRLKLLGQGKFLPEYKNPCWWRDSSKSTLQCLPYFYIAGFPKCGTTDLYARVTKHPLIVPGKQKEPHYITRSMFWDKSLRDLSPEETSRQAVDYYTTHFFGSAAKLIRANGDSSKNNKIPKAEWNAAVKEASRKLSHPFITVDGSASTAWDRDEWRHFIENFACSEPLVGPPHFISQLNPDVKVILIVRDPTTRLYSDYMYFKKNATREDFHERVLKTMAKFDNCMIDNSLPVCLLYPSREPVRLALGIYHQSVADWLGLIPRSQLLVLRSESYHDDIAGTLARIFNFLDLPALSKQSLAKLASMGDENKGKVQASSAPMMPETEQVLRKFYAEHNRKLAALLQDEQFLWRM